MKNTLILMLAFSILLSGIMPTIAYGEPVSEKQMENAILKVKELFSISNDYDNFVSNVNTYDEEVSFYLSWSDSKEELPSINVHVDAKGNIISFNKYYNQEWDSQPKLPSLSREEAEKIAMDFIEKVDPVVFKEIELKQTSQPISTWERYYNFNFIRNVNGIPYPSNTVYLNVDMEKGEVSSYNVNWERKLDFPITENIISLDEAREAYKKEIGLKLVYKRSGRTYFRDSGENEINYFLAYTNLGELKGIDAETGEKINISYYYPVTRDVAVAKEENLVYGEAPIITPEEREEIQKLQGIKAIEAAEKEARKILKLDSSYKLQRSNLHSSWINPGDFVYSLSFLKTSEERNYNAEMSLDAKTLEVISFYKYRDMDYNSKAKINKDEALSMAKEFINEINPDKVDQIEYLEMNSYNNNEQYYGFNFMRKIDDIYVESDSISIGVDAVNKEINSYSINWYKGEFPARDKIISIDKAYEVLFNKIGYDLTYNDIYNYETGKTPEREVKLVYSVNPDKPLIIDAFTGSILDYSGNPYKDSTIPVYTDIEDSYAGDKIKTLAEYGVGFDSDEFKPKENIKQKDYLYLLWKTMNPYRIFSEEDMDAVYKELIRQNIVQSNEENRERIVTKEEAVKFVVRAMGYEKLAKIPGIYADVFNDGELIDPALKGYMTIAYGLNIINGDSTGHIKPKAELKREDAANIIYNYLFN